MITRLFLPALLFLSGCQSKPVGDAPAPASAPALDPKEEQRLHKAGLVLISDLQHTSAWERLIHVEMGVPPRKIEVKEGPGLTTIIIHELKNRANAESVAQGLRQYADKNPQKYGPTKVEISLSAGAPTISPFVLPTEVGSIPLNQESALPTLSLPPLRLDGR